jgi:hypothetical protein
MQFQSLGNVLGFFHFLPNCVLHPPLPCCESSVALWTVPLLDDFGLSSSNGEPHKETGQKERVSHSVLSVALLQGGCIIYQRPQSFQALMSAVPPLCYVHLWKLKMHPTVTKQTRCWIFLCFTLCKSYLHFTSCPVISI